MYKHKVTEILLAEEGYLEKSAAAVKKNPNVLYSKKDGAGSDNYTKYGKEMHDIYPSIMDYPAYWCDAFNDWGFYKAYGVTNAKGLLGGNFDDYTKGSINLYKSKKAFYRRGKITPDEGVQVFFSKDDTFAGVHHTGYVYAYDGTYIYTVEGNTSNTSEVVANGGGVWKKMYKITDPRIYGYGLPLYSRYEQTEKLGWIKSGDDWYYRISVGKNAHGWNDIKNADGKVRRYYFDSKGKLLYEWQLIEGKWYYFEPRSNELAGALYKSDDAGAQKIWIIE